MMTTEAMLAYHGDPALKAAVLAQMADHRAAERLVKGTYWSWTSGRGCAVGCLTYNPTGGHAEYPERWGIPEKLAWLEDAVFEHLPLDHATAWPLRFLAAIEPGSDLSGIYAAWSAALMLDPERGNITRCAGSLEAESAVRRVAGLWQVRSAEPVEWSTAAAAAAAAESAACSAKPATSAAAESAARSAWSSARSAESTQAAASAAYNAARSAWWQARSTRASAASAPLAWLAHWRWMADLLIAFVEAAPVAMLAEPERVGR